MSPAAISRIGEFCETGSGGTPSREKSARYYDGGTIPWVKSGELRETIITDTEEHVTETALKESSAKLVPSGAILLAMYGATVGRLGILGVEASTNQAVCHIVPDPKLADVRYLFHALRAQVAQLIRRGVGGAQPNISQGIVKDIAVPLPAMAEQRRIAEVLDRAEALRAKRRAALSQLDTLTQSIFLSLFGDPHRNQNDWPRRPMSELFAAPPIFGSMIPPVGERRGWLALRVGNIQDWTLDLHDRKYVELPAEAAERHSVKEGDLLLARAIASEEHLGKCIVADPGEERWAFDSHLMRLRFDRGQAEPEFIRHLFMTPGGRRLFLGASRKSTVQFNINTKEISALRIPVPPFILQQEFARRIALVEKLKATYCASLAKLDTLFAVLQHRAFRGEL